MPLAAGFGEGAELLRPLAITMVSGLSFSMFVSLWLVPIVYSLLGRRDTGTVESENETRASATHGRVAVTPEATL